MLRCVLRYALLLTFSLGFISCSKDDELLDVAQGMQHESVLNANSGWTTVAYDDEIFYPWGGFSGFLTIEMSHPFVYDGQARAIGVYTRENSTGTSKDIVAVNDNEFQRYPFNTSGDHFIKNGDIYENWITDNDEVHLRRFNAPDYSSYNTYEWDFDEVKTPLSRLDYSLGYLFDHGTFDISIVDDKPHAINCLFVNLNAVGETTATPHLLMTSKNISTYGGSIEQVSVLPEKSSLDGEFYMDMKSQAIGEKVMTAVIGLEKRNTYFVLGSFADGFQFIKELTGYRKIEAFFAGKENYFCVLTQDGSSRKFGFKIDLDGNVTELGEVTGAYENGYTHYKGELTVAIHDETNGTEQKVSVKQFTASGVNVLGAESLTTTATIETLMSDGDHLFGAAVNNISPKYFSGGRQFYGWEVFQFNN